MQAEATLEKQALEERVRAGELKLATARRERNALLAALRDLQGRRQPGSDHPLSPLAPSDLETSHGGGGMAIQELDDATDIGGDVSGGSSVGRGGGRAVGGEAELRGQSHAAPVVTALGSRVENIRQQSRPPEFVESRSAGGLKEGDGAIELGERGMGGSKGMGSRGAPAGEGGGRTASLSARLEALALQTQQLLDDGTDSSDDSG